MSTEVICHGCGQPIPVADDYRRNKIQCPGCGVICPVPEDAPRRGSGAAPAPRQPARAAPPSLEDEAADWLTDSPSPPPVAEAEPLRPRPEPASAVVSESPTTPAPGPPETRFTCRRCGNPVRRQRECPVCGIESDAPLSPDPDQAPPPAPPPAPVVGLAPGSLELDEEEPAMLQPAEDEDEPSPYLLADKDLPRCPRCRKDMPQGAVLCASCGFNLRTRKKAKRSYEPIARYWETNLSLQTRLICLAAYQGVHLLLTIGAGLGGHATPFLASWVPFTIMLAFVLGTYDSINLVRDTRGRVTLTKRWRVCFIPLAPQVTEVRGFEGVVTGQWNDSGVFEWVVFLCLLFLWIVPAFVWWYLAIHGNSYHLALAADHGHAEVYVYRGRSEEQMRDILKARCDATGLRNIS